MRQSFTKELSGGAAFASVVALSGCTLTTGVNDYQVDPQVEIRDLNFTLQGMGAHEGQQLDVAIVERAHTTLQGRAIVLFRPGTAADYPDEQIVMASGLGRGAYDLYFFIDSSPDICADAQKVCPEGAKLCLPAQKTCPSALTEGLCGPIKGLTFCRDGEVEDKEHDWIKPVNPDGTYLFKHSTTFQSFTSEDYESVGNDLVFQLGDKELALFNEALQQHNFELRLTLTSEERQVGLFRAYKRTRLFGDLRLAGIVDAGNDYRLESVVDGVVTKSVDLQAPQEGDLVIALKQISFSPKK